MVAINLCGKRVKLARIQNDLHQVDLAAALSVDCGIEISQKGISNIERGARGVTDVELVAFSQVLGVSIDWLLFGDKGKNAA